MEGIRAIKLNTIAHVLKIIRQSLRENLEISCILRIVPSIAVKQVEPESRP